MLNNINKNFEKNLKIFFEAQIHITINLVLNYYEYYNSVYFLNLFKVWKEEGFTAVEEIQVYRSFIFHIIFFFNVIYLTKH